MVAPAWIALKSATNLNRLSSENHLSFHVRDPEAVFSLSSPTCSLSVLADGHNSDVARTRAKVTH